MKLFTSILLVLAFGLIIFNLTQLDYGNLFAQESMIALIGIVAAFCAILILLIFRMSKTIEDKLKDQE
ncbi:MAG TPA: hypothetical protein P5335_01935 [Flavobacterium sp.]|jgi:hypothetical protein|nr:hypothetical protein [Flavobacterium sp.]HQV36207.1 hypothetical protein [Flavobacterium sp.]HQX04487.1 hypothetical protein [Flavobacterium sp.]HRZ31133.1 hypothetical protein [Flavobacterium sp.]HRZ73670.1 hypothetical protein [Flavobacterium sp.]